MDFSALILLAVICVAVAVLIGYLLATVLGSRASSSPPPQARQEGLDQLISFWSDRQMRRILPQINGKAIESPHLLKENERRQLLLLYQALRKWLEVETPTVGAVNDGQPSPQEQPPAQAVLPKVEMPPAAQPATKKGVADWLAQSFQPKSNLTQAPRSIAMQVDEILQKKLQERGLQQRGVRLMELPNKGMVVLIGLEQYATVEEVPDAEIQALIRASVSEWETNMMGG